MIRMIVAAIAVLSTIVTAAASDVVPIVVVEANAVVGMHADHAYIPVLVGVRGDAPPDVRVTAEDVDRVRDRIEAAGIAPTAIAEHRLVPIDAKDRAEYGQSMQGDAYGLVLIRIDRPDDGAVDAFAERLAPALREAPRRGLYAEEVVARYSVDDCDAPGRAARSAAIAAARTRASEIAGSIGRTLADAPPTLRPTEYPDSEPHPFVCGRGVFPTIPYPGIQTTHDDFRYPGRYVARFAAATAWRLTSAVSPASDAAIPPTLTSEHADPPPDSDPLKPGMLRSRVAIANDDVPAQNDEAHVLSIAAAEAHERIRWLENAVGIHATRLAVIHDSRTVFSHVGAVMIPEPDRFHTRPSTSLAVTYADRLAGASATNTIHVEGSGDAQRPADHVMLRLALPIESDARTQATNALRHVGIACANARGPCWATIDHPTPEALASAVEAARGAAPPLGNIKPVGFVAADDCAEASHAALDAAVASARTNARAEAANLGMALGAIVAAEEIGTVATPGLCGRNVLDIPNLRMSGLGDLARPINDTLTVTSHVSVTLLFATNAK